MAVHEGVEDAIDHAEVVVANELLTHIDEVFVDGIETAGEEFAEMEAEGGGFLEDEFGIGDDVEAGGSDGADHGGVRDAKQRGEISKDGTGLGGCGDGDVVFNDFDGTFDEDVKKAGVFTLGEDDVALGEVLDWVIFEGGQDGWHSRLGFCAQTGVVRSALLCEVGRIICWLNQLEWAWWGVLAGAGIRRGGNRVLRKGRSRCPASGRVLRRRRGRCRAEASFQSRRRSGIS